MGKPLQVVEYKGRTRILIELCEELDRNPILVRTRMRNGWDVERAVDTPSKFGGDYGRWKNYQQWLVRNKGKSGHFVTPLGFE